MMNFAVMISNDCEMKVWKWFSHLERILIIQTIFFSDGDFKTIVIRYVRIIYTMQNILDFLNVFFFFNFIENLDNKNFSCYENYLFWKNRCKFFGKLHFYKVGFLLQFLSTMANICFVQNFKIKEEIFMSILIVFWKKQSYLLRLLINVN